LERALRPAGTLRLPFAARGTALYPWTFFGQRRLDRSLASAAALLGSAAGTAVAASRIDAPATACMVPVVAWVGLANLFAEELWRRNR
jgi:tryptophan-rich sensory protein